MLVEIDEKSGFCFGVVTAIARAEELVRSSEKVYCLEDIVHNRVEVQRLENLGVKTISHDEFMTLRGETVLVRAHGEPPKTYREARQRDIEIVDATCPVVASLQKTIIKAYEKMQQVAGQVVLLGKRGHAEVVGLIGQVEGDVTVVENEAELDVIDCGRAIYFLSQTTQSLDLFNAMAEKLRLRCGDDVSLTVHDTICRQVSGRGPHLREFAGKFDVIIFVSGKKSSNGKVLFGICYEQNKRSYKVEDAEELRPEWFENCESVGICGATSTPKWLMSEVFCKIQELVNQEVKK
ncbi:MAG: 4-hydroxy-3-methylbut-2-enyl diphosphate reductase [Rikenellaceae bacterium]